MQFQGGLFMDCFFQGAFVPSPQVNLPSILQKNLYKNWILQETLKKIPYGKR